MLLFTDFHHLGIDGSFHKLGSKNVYHLIKLYFRLGSHPDDFIIALELCFHTTKVESCLKFPVSLVNGIGDLVPVDL